MNLLALLCLSYLKSSQMFSMQLGFSWPNLDQYLLNSFAMTISLVTSFFFITSLVGRRDLGLFVLSHTSFMIFHVFLALFLNSSIFFCVWIVVPFRFTFYYFKYVFICFILCLPFGVSSFKNFSYSLDNAIKLSWVWRKL